MIKENGYYYNHQLTTYVRQFMAIFTGMQVQVGKWNDQDERLIPVEIAYGHRDRVVASILAENTQNKPLRLPTMSAYPRGLRRDLTRSAGTGTERRQTYVPMGGLVPDDIRTIHQRKASAYILEMELGIYTSNTDQMFQILEPILTIFDPLLNIQTSDALFDMKRLSAVQMTNINFDNNYPIGMDRRINQTTITFDLEIWIDVPAEVRSEFVNKIFVRVGAVSQGANTNEEMIIDLDSQNIPYELWQDGDAVKID